MVVKEAIDCDIKNANQSRVRLTGAPLGCLQNISPLYFFVFTDTTGVTTPKKKKGSRRQVNTQAAFPGQILPVTQESIQDSTLAVSIADHVTPGV